MSNQNLYFDDPYCFTFEAQVMEQFPLPNGRHGVILERTYFYPTGGGQEHDCGWLGEQPVLEVFSDPKRSVTVHVVAQPLQVQRLLARIDAERRLRHMEHHTAQHLLSYCFRDTFGWETLSANINGDTPSTLDLQAEEPTAEQIAQVEALANRLIRNNLVVKSYYVSPAQAAALPLRKPPPNKETIRIVEIEGLDYSACGGTHVRQTGAIGVVKILRSERLRGKTRIHFVAGSRALEAFQKAYAVAHGLAAQLSVGLLELPAAVQRLSDQLKNTQRELNTWKERGLLSQAQRLYQEAQHLAGRRLVLAALQEYSLSDLRALGKHLASLPGAVAVLMSHEGERLNVVSACSSDSQLSARNLLQATLEPFGGRGGGDEHLAQGGVVESAAQPGDLLEAARRFLAQTLE